jgi:outer membrane protein OmpA-like peptidoglycan-associated protein
MGETAFRVHNPEQREPNKRNGGDLQIIELDISQRESFDRMVNSLNITKVENVIKNEDGTFKGEYFKENKIHSGRNKVSNNEDNKQVEAEQKYGAKQKRDISGDVVRFKHNSDDIIPLSNKTIEDIKRTLNAYPDKQIGITGYASIEGNNEDNVNLFLKRALKVKEYLVNNDIDPIRILYVEGAGTTEKYDNPNNNEDQNLEANRVVEINITYEKTQAD